MKELNKHSSNTNLENHNDIVLDIVITLSYYFIDTTIVKQPAFNVGFLTF